MCQFSFHSLLNCIINVLFAKALVITGKMLFPFVLTEESVVVSDFVSVVKKVCAVFLAARGTSREAHREASSRPSALLPCCTCRDPKKTSEGPQNGPAQAQGIFQESPLSSDCSSKQL